MVEEEQEEEEQEEDGGQQQNVQIENEDWNGNNQEQNNNAGNLSTGNGPEASAENKSVRLWKKIFDSNTGYNYYYDRVTGRTTWEKPPDFTTALIPVHLRKHLVGV